MPDRGGYYGGYLLRNGNERDAAAQQSGPVAGRRYRQCGAFDAARCAARRHIVQGHVDQTAVCTAVDDAEGSWYFTFKYEPAGDNCTVEKGSITVNGVSLTVCNSQEGQFQVAIIPYTYEHTNFNRIKPGTLVNLEFDIIGKYIARLMKNYLK